MSKDDLDLNFDDNFDNVNDNFDQDQDIDLGLDDADDTDLNDDDFDDNQDQDQDQDSNDDYDDDYDDYDDDDDYEDSPVTHISADDMPEFGADSIQKEAKTVEQAIADALEELHATEDEVDVEILETGSKGILGFGAKSAQVKVTLKPNPVRQAKAFIHTVTKAMGVDIVFATKTEDKQLQIDMIGNHMGVLIGKHGQTLDALQYLTNLVANKGDVPYLAITLDAENYRQRRRETLESLAFNLAKKAKLSRRSIRLEPMSAYERRIIHAVLQNDKYVTTHSEGDEPHRHVVIALKRENNRPSKYADYD